MTFVGKLESKQHRFDSPEFPKHESPIDSLGGDGAKRRSAECVMSFDETGTRLLVLNIKVSRGFYFD